MKGKKGYIYRIRLSDNMLHQADVDKSLDWKDYHLKEYPTYDAAYLVIVGKWGSASLDTPMGLVIDRKKIGTKEWRFTYGA